MISWLGSLWGKVAAGAVALTAIAGAVVLWLAGIRRRASEAERARIEAATRERELEERRIRDDVEADVAGLDADERRSRLRAWGRD
jgi:hypothetical protein